MITRRWHECNTALDFQPLINKSRALPYLSWGYHLLEGFETETPDKTVLDIKGSAPLEQVLSDIHPQLSLPELARLMVKLEKENLFVDKPQLFKFYGLAYNHNLEKTLLALNDTPSAFQNWCSQKKLHSRDLAILRAPATSALRNEILSSLAKLNPSKSLGTSLLEMGLELIETHANPTEILKILDEKPESAHNKLESLRRPHSSQQLKDHQNKIRTLGKVPGIEMQWRRQGDAQGLELKIFAENPTVLNTKLISLNKWLQQSQEDEWI